MKKFLALLLALSMVFCFAACGGNGNDEPETGTQAPDANVTSDLAYVKENGKLIVGITDYPPMNYQENGKWVGFDTELTYAFAEKLGVDVEFVVLADWGKKFIELSSKSVDCVWNGMTITDEALLNSNVSTAYVKNAQVVVMKNDKLADYADAESIKVEIGGFYYEQNMVDHRCKQRIWK